MEAVGTVRQGRCRKRRLNSAGAVPRLDPDAVAAAHITNAGDGIPAADHPYIFERFYRVEKSRDRARGGAGIGLAIVKQLVESGGGRVGAESHAGLTHFWFSVPA